MDLERYPKTYIALNKELSQWKKTAEDLKDELYANSRRAYKLFVEIYPTLTSGGSFVPHYTDDAIQYILLVNETLVAQTQFNGLFIVYDEFSKFIEGNLEKANMPNYKVIQELAELATRSDASKSIVFSCITHKDFLDYSDAETIRTVEGRFKKLWYIQTASQLYNRGIVAAYQYSKMYIVRPHLFIQLISLLRDAALNNLQTRRELTAARQQNLDVQNFENAMLDFKEKFNNNVRHAAQNFDEAIKRIDESIKQMELVKEALRKTRGHLEQADKKAQDLSIKKLTKDSPSVREKFIEAGATIV